MIQLGPKNKIIISLIKDNQRIFYIEQREQSKQRKIKHVKQSCPTCNRLMNETKEEKKNLFNVMNRLRFKSNTYGAVFQTYHPEMNFAKMLEAGWKEI